MGEVGGARIDGGSLAQRLEALSVDVGRLEEALAEGRPVDPPPALAQAYERRRARPRPSLPFRPRAVGELLARARRLFAAPRLLLPVEVQTWVSASGAVRLGLACGSHGVVVRPERLLRPRFWGIAPASRSPDDQRLLDETAWDTFLRRFTSDLISVTKIEEQFDGRAIDGELQLLPAEIGESFEHLLLDLLDEIEPCAREASLYEDFIEKTDLRVHAPGVDRKRGSRVQVTWTIDAERLRLKREEIRDHDELVLLSPRTLAESLHDPTFAYPPALIDPCERVLGTQGQPIDHAARSLRSLFRHALLLLGDDPRGPLALVPEPIRELVRAFVRHEAARSTRALRSNEAAQARLRAEAERQEAGAQGEPGGS